MRVVPVLLISVLCLAGCATIDYVGREYPPTSHVDIYFSLDEVSRDYEVMGHVIATGNAMVSAEKMQEQMLEKARQKGADAIVILGFERYISGESSKYTETTETSVEDDKTEETTTAVTKTTTEETKEVKATLLKYR
ncbi:MAG: hypothetical protein JSW03_09780 [Candidatus Eiseniibacteriota bacterium]|nr:MAG: hypothetical protein JSW03_09780 [Candidatus Eisenbacteria bacterium]